MSIYNEIMNDPYLERMVLIEFGFGKVYPHEVEKWVKEKYPMVYAELKRHSKSSKVVPMEVETMSREQRNAILDRLEKAMKGGDAE